MPAQLIIYLGIALAAPFLLVAVLAFALARRYRGRRVPTWAKWSGAFLTGFCVSPAFIIGEDLWWLILPSLPVIWVAWVMARSGRFRLAGLIALGLTLPAALYWASLLLTDAIDAAELFGPGLYFRFVSVAVGSVMGIGLFVIGDHPPARPRIVQQPGGTTRDPFTLANAMTAALMFGPFSLPSLVAESVAFVVTVVAVSIAIWIAAPWPITLIGGALLFMLIGTELWYRSFPSRSRQAWGGYAYVGHAEMERWRATTGTRPPTSPNQFQAWLRDNVERPETRWAHAEMLAVVGRLAEARAMAERMDASTPAELFDRQSMIDYIDWIDGQDVDAESRLREADMVGAPASAERLYARGAASIALARVRADEGGDWMEPLIGFDQEVRPAGWAAWRADTRRQRMIATFLLGLALSAVSVIPVTLLGPAL